MATAASASRTACLRRRTELFHVWHLSRAGLSGPIDRPRTVTKRVDHIAQRGDQSDQIAQREGLHHSTVNELLRLTLLEPAIIQAIVAGQQPRCMSLLWFQRNPLPTDWGKQRAVVAAFDR
jgi:hypothetical protein